VPVPPVTVRSIAPVEAPLHSTFVTTVLKARAGGSVTVALVVLVQPFASVTVTVYVPAVKLLISSVVWPLDHK